MLRPRHRSCPPPAAEASPILGRWFCFGPLTGRGLGLPFDSNGRGRGSADGKPVRGRYLVQNGQLKLIEDAFQIEQLDASRMVLAKSQGRRLACKR